MSEVRLRQPVMDASECTVSFQQSGSAKRLAFTCKWSIRFRVDSLKDESTRNRVAVDVNSGLRMFSMRFLREVNGKNN